MNLSTSTRGLAKIFAAVLCLAALGACRTVANPFSGTRSWSAKAGGGQGASIRFIKVSAEKSGGWAFLEQELEAMAPLIFWERGCYFYGDGQKTDYAADLRVREREYTIGWRTKRCLALEIRVWEDRGDNPRRYLTTPLAAAQVISLGNKSLSSSKELNRMLRRAVGRVVWVLGKKKAGANGAAP